MPNQYGFATLSATGRYAMPVDKNTGPGDNLACVNIGVGASAWTMTATIQGNPFTSVQDPNNRGWMNIQSVRQDTGAFESTPTLTANTARTWECNAEPYQQIAFNVTALSGTVPFNIQSYFRQNGLGVTQTQAVAQAISGALVITSTAAQALAVGANGGTNPVLSVNANTSSVATGLTIVGAAAASGVALQVITSGTNEDLTIDAAAAGTVKIGTVASTALGLQVGSSTSAANATLIVQSTNLKALVVGRLGATTPAFQVDANTATSITGVKIKSAATGNGVAISAIGEASNGKLSIDAQGSGVLALGDTSTGGVGLNRGALQALQVGMTLTAIGTTQNSTPTAAQLLGGILTQTSATGAGTITLPTGTLLSAACPRTPVAGDTFKCTFANLGGGQTLTVTGVTGTTVSGGATIATAKSATLVFTNTGSNAWSIYTVGG